MTTASPATTVTDDFVTYIRVPTYRQIFKNSGGSIDNSCQKWRVRLGNHSTSSERVFSVCETRNKRTGGTEDFAFDGSTNIPSLYIASPLLFTPPTEGFPWEDFRKILQGGQRMVEVQNGEEILPKVSAP